MMKFAKKALIAAVLVVSTTPALAADTTVDTAFYTNLLHFIQAQFAYEGAEFDVFSNALDANGNHLFSAAALSELSSSFNALNSAQLTLVQYLQTKVTVG